MAPTSPSSDGYFGEVFARALVQRGVRAIVTDTGIRDVAELSEMGFPAWSSAVCVQGTVKATAGAVNVPIVIGGTVVRAGDVIVADDDGVVCVPRDEAEEVAVNGEDRVAKEIGIMRAIDGGETTLDLYGLRARIEDFGVKYVPYLDGTRSAVDQE